MKKKLISFLLVFTVIVGMVSVRSSTTVQAVSKKSSFITNKKFKGTFGYKGEKGGYEDGWYNLIIHKITKNGKVSFNLDKGGRYASPLYGTSVLTAKIKGNTTKFVYKGDGWGNKGKGTIVFNKNGTIYLTVKQTYTAEGNRSSLQIPKTLFKKVSK